eukprot:1387505-Rhodomonas_salina.1
MARHTPMTDSACAWTPKERETMLKETARPAAETRSMGRRPTRSKSSTPTMRNATLLTPATVVATSALLPSSPTPDITSGT